MKNKKEFTGSSVSYYQVRIDHPASTSEPYTAECVDIIEALGMTWSEANVFKAVWRIAASRLGKSKKGHSNLYDAEKVVYFGLRILEREKRNGRKP